jgi:HlyD family secretion protein
MDRTRSKSKARSLRRIISLAALVALLVGGGVTLAHIDFNTVRVDRDKIGIATVEQGTMEIKVSANGQLLPKNIEYIAAQVGGRVARKYVKAGDVVKAGQVLLELTNPQVIASSEGAYSAWEGSVTELKAAEAELKTNLMNQDVVLTQAQFNLERSQLQLEAETKLIGQHVVAEIDYKRSQLNVAQLIKTRDIEASRRQTIGDNIKVELAVKQARVTELARALDRAKNDANNLKIVAGIDGIVQVVSVDIGQELSPGSPVGRIAQPDLLYAELKVAAREATEVQPKQRVLIDTHNGTVEGFVTRIDPAVTDGSVIVDASLDGPLPAGARPQLPIEGVVYLSQLPHTLYVGKPAYVKSNSDISVYKLDAAGRYASRVTIKAGKVSLNYLQVLQGLSAGDRIITSEIGSWQGKDRILIN